MDCLAAFNGRMRDFPGSFSIKGKRLTMDIVWTRAVQLVNRKYNSPVRFGPRLLDNLVIIIDFAQRTPIAKINATITVHLSSVRFERWNTLQYRKVGNFTRYKQYSSPFRKTFFRYYSLQWNVTLNTRLQCYNRGQRISSRAVSSMSLQ